MNGNDFVKMRFWIFRAFISLVILILGCSGAPVTAFAQTPATLISVSPAASSVPTCAETQIDIRVQDVVGLVGYSVQLSFTPGSIEILDVTEGGFLDSGFYEPTNTFNNTAGTISFGMVQVNPSTPKDGSGDLIHIHLRATHPGVNVPININPDTSVLVGADYLSIPFTVENAVIFTYSCQTYLPLIQKDPGR